MIVRIQAQERQMTIGDVAIATGNAQPMEASRTQRKLNELASGRTMRAAKATPAVLSGMGIGVRSTSSTASEKAGSDG
tara:strand:- start:466 stop:699 length:234 start_codon:yes stop_codon:yes gene_type:complete